MDNPSENISNELRRLARSIMLQKVFLPAAISVALIILSPLLFHLPKEILLILTIIALAVVAFFFILIISAPKILSNRYVLNRYINDKVEMFESYQALAREAWDKKAKILAADPFSLEPYPKIIHDLKLIMKAFESFKDNIDEVEQERLEQIATEFNQVYFQFVKHNQGETFIKETEARELQVKKIARSFRAFREEKLQEFSRIEEEMLGTAKSHQNDLAEIYSKASEEFFSLAEKEKAKELRARELLELA